MDLQGLKVPGFERAACSKCRERKAVKDLINYRIMRDVNTEMIDGENSQ